MQWVTHTAKDEDIYEILGKKNKIINRYPNVKHLSRKDNFELMMKFPVDVLGDEYDFTPRTFVIPDD